MRLFIAINFNVETRLRLVGLRDELSMGSIKGRFSTPENFHLTLAFLGECDEKQTAALQSIMDTIQFKAFALNIGGLGRFRRDGGDVWWAGVSDNKSLIKLQKQLANKLSESGFKMENRKFNPHITLGREIVTNMSPYKFGNFGQTVNKIELMKSERINGRLVYTTIYETKADRT